MLAYFCWCIKLIRGTVPSLDKVRTAETAAKGSYVKAEGKVWFLIFTARYNHFSFASNFQQVILFHCSRIEPVNHLARKNKVYWVSYEDPEQLIRLPNALPQSSETARQWGHFWIREI